MNDTDIIQEAALCSTIVLQKAPILQYYCAALSNLLSKPKGHCVLFVAKGYYCILFRFKSDTYKNL